MGLFDDIRKIMSEPAGGGQDDRVLAPAGGGNGRPNRPGGLGSAFGEMRGILSAIDEVRSIAPEEPRRTSSNLVQCEDWEDVRPIGSARGAGKRYTFLVDKSGSMHSGGVAKSFCSVHKSMLDRIAQSDPKATVTYAEYDTTCEVRYRNVPISKATSPVMHPSGGTEFPTALGKVIGGRKHFRRGDVVIIITDGDISGWTHDVTFRQAAEITKASLDAGAEFWFIADMGSLRTAQRRARDLYIPADHVRLWTHTPEGLQAAVDEVTDVLTLGAAR